MTALASSVRKRNKATKGVQGGGVKHSDRQVKKKKKSKTQNYKSRSYSLGITRL